MAKPDTNNDEDIRQEQNDTVKEYQQVTVKELTSALDSNALKAERTYQDMYVEVTGYLRNIDSDGNYITITATNDDWDFESLHCEVTNDAQLDIILEKSVGDEVTIQGQITSVGEVMGYYIDIDTIQ